MIQRKTQDLAYWRDQYQVDKADHEFLYETLADVREPQRVADLARAVIRRRCQQEESRIRNELTRGLIYDPRDDYKVGDEVVFPAFDFRLAGVLSVRAGQNPEHGAFQVITVRFTDAAEERDFAASLPNRHALNRDGGPIKFTDEDLLTPEEIDEIVGDAVAQKVEKHLIGNPNLFVSAGPLWLTTDHMVAVNMGHLNIAEAAMEMSAAPMSTQALLAIVDVDRNAADAVRVFSLETALYGDERFVQVGAADSPAWYLRRLIPNAALETPPALQYTLSTYDRTHLDVELLQSEWELSDEWAAGGLTEEAPSQIPQTSIILIYPHLASGTLPLSPAVRAIFPRGSGPCTAITIVDRRWGKRFPAWVNHKGRYVAGFSDWFVQHKLPVGARITIERSNNPEEVIVDFRPQRAARREWMRIARIEDDRLTFRMDRHQFGCDYDEHVALVAADNPVEISRAAAGYKDMSVQKLVQQIMPELTKLSPQGTAHVKTLYSAVNVVRRLPPGPIFAALVQISGATDTGSGFWSL